MSNFQYDPTYTQRDEDPAVFIAVDDDLLDVRLERPIKLSALLVEMIAPNGKLVRILDIEDYVSFMEHMGYVRVSGAA